MPAEASRASSIGEFTPAFMPQAAANAAIEHACAASRLIVEYQWGATAARMRSPNSRAACSSGG
jgi:hypothetical protein